MGRDTRHPEFLPIAPPGWLAGTKPQEIVETADGALRLLRPIVVAAPCLTCHGAPANIDPEVRRLLAERYPNDQATGYRTGDFRGAVWVRIAAP